MGGQRLVNKQFRKYKHVMPKSVKVDPLPPPCDDCAFPNPYKPLKPRDARVVANERASINNRFFLMNPHNGLLLHGDGENYTSKREYAWFGTLEQAANLVKEKPRLKSLLPRQPAGKTNVFLRHDGLR